MARGRPRKFDPALPVADPKESGIGSFYNFSRWLYPKYPIIEHLHSPFCDMYQRNLDHVLKWRGQRGQGESQRITLALMPRWSLKTTLGVHAFATYATTIEPNIRILFGSQTEDLSRKSLGVIKRIFESDQNYKDRFGNRKPDPKAEGNDLRLMWSQNGFTVADRTEHHLKEQTVEIVGMSNVNPGYHYDLIVLDDPHGRANADQIEKTWAAMKDLVWLLEPWGALMVTMTRWDYYDVAQRMIYDWESSLSEPVIKRPADDGLMNSLIPQLYSEKTLRSIRSKMTAYEYSCQMRLEPTSPEDQRFPEAFYKEEDIDPRDAEWIAVTVDPGYPDGKTESRDSESAIVVGGWLKGGFYHQWDCESGTWDEVELLDKIMFHLQKWRASRLGVEKSSLTGFLSLPLETRLQRLRLDAQIYPVLEDMKPDGKKFKRVRAWVDHYNSGKCSFSPRMTDAVKFKSQLFAFPSITKMDLLDAWAYQRVMADQRVPPDRMKVKTKEELRDMKMDALVKTIQDGRVEEIAWLNPKAAQWARS